MSYPARPVSRRSFLSSAAALAGLGAAGPLLTPLPARAAGDDGPIRVGVLHSLSGTMGISEVNLMGVIQMLIDEQNARGGLLGRRLEPLLTNPASDWDLYASLARDMLTKQGVSVIFGCWTSASRKAVLPVVEELNGLLYYPLQYEGQESSRNIFYTGAAPNQQAIPAINYLYDAIGIRKFALFGTDYIYPRTVNRIIVAHLRNRGVPDSNIIENYTGFSNREWDAPLDALTRMMGFGDGRKTAILSTINGDANLHFFRALVLSGRRRLRDVPVMALSVGELEMSNMDRLTIRLARPLTTWNYFQSIDTDSNRDFVRRWQTMAGYDAVTSDPMEAHMIGFSMWIKAVERAGTTDVDAVRQAMYGIETPNLSNGVARMLTNHHITKPVYIGSHMGNGQFRILDRKPSVAADAWSDLLPESVNLKADWQNLNCGRYDMVQKTCLTATG